MIRRSFLLTAAGATASRAFQAWESLFDGKQWGNWKPTAFSGQGRVRIEDGVIILEPGKPLTGVTWTGQFPKSDYELRYEAMRRRGNDLFATVTFPVGDNYCTWVTGGWGGDIVGLSSIDGWDASENETRTYFTFENHRWYRLRLRVTLSRISAWIDDHRIIDTAIEGREIGLRRGEIRLSAPLGFASYATEGAIRNIAYRQLAA